MAVVVNHPLTEENLELVSSMFGLHENDGFNVTLGDGADLAITGAGVEEVTEKVLDYWEALGHPWKGGELCVFGVCHHWDPAFEVDPYLMERLEGQTEDLHPGTSNGNTFLEMMERLEERTPEVQGKLFQRMFANQSGIFAQPDYRDYSDYKLARPFPRTFSDIDFSAFPVDQMLAMKGKGVTFMFENPVDGFVFLHGKDCYRFWTKNEAVRRAWNASVGETEFGKRVHAFLDLLSHGLDLRKISWARIPEEEASDVDRITARVIAASVLAAENELYIKDALGGAGQMVLRKVGTFPNVVIRSDSPELPEILQRLVEWRESVLEDKSEEFSPEEIEEIRKAGTPDPLNLLELCVATMPYPIAEEVIPYEAVDGKRAEFRLISMLLPGEGAFTIPGHYAKVSASEDTANISLGGYGEKSLDVIVRMYRGRFPDLPEDRVQQRAKDLLDRMLADTVEFSNRYYEYMEKEMGVSIPRHFAVDLCPAWDEEQSDFVLYLVEVNLRYYGFKGLKACDPEAAQHVLALQQECFPSDVLPESI